MKRREPVIPPVPQQPQQEDEPQAGSIGDDFDEDDWKLFETKF